MLLLLITTNVAQNALLQPCRRHAYMSALYTKPSQLPWSQLFVDDGTDILVSSNFGAGTATAFTQTGLDTSSAALAVFDG